MENKGNFCYWAVPTAQLKDVNEVAETIFYDWNQQNESNALESKQQTSLSNSLDSSENIQEDIHQPINILNDNDKIDDDSNNTASRNYN